MRGAGRPLILVVEDDPNDVALLQRAVRRAQIALRLQIVSDGEEAVHYLSGQGPYSDRTQYGMPVLVLLDLKLPRLSGHEVLTWLRSQPLLKRLPVVVLTSSEEATDIDRAYDLGANSYLVKPSQFDTFLEIVRALHRYWIEFNEKPTVA